MFKSFPRVCSYDNAAVSKLVHMKVQKYRKAVKKKKAFTDKALSNRVCSPVGDVCAVMLHIKWQLSPQVPMVGNSPKSSWWDFSPNKDAWEFWNLPPI